jgi:hypothetical protein
MSSQRRAETHSRAPSRLLFIWMGGFLIVSALASLIFFNVVREIVRGWNTTQLAAPVATGVTLTDPQTGQPVVEIPEWKGVERTILLLASTSARRKPVPHRHDDGVDSIRRPRLPACSPFRATVQIPSWRRKGRSTPRTF